MLLAFLLVALQGEEPLVDPAPPRPRVGLVLSGGGARGAAHVGVLKVLEELQVPVDLVVGTSMGAIIGGLYATGYAPEEMEQILDEANWATLLSDEPPRDQLWFRRRQDERVFRVDVEVGWRDGGIVLPPGLILGQNVESFLEQLTLPVADVHDFDLLRLPFRCMATDLNDGSPVVLGKGSLAKAIRASMSLPGIFAPVELEGRLLVDGGVVDNVPIDVARELGAEVIIVVDISTPVSELPEGSSSLGVSNQVVSLLMSENRRRSLSLVEEGDVSITPDLRKVTTLGFDQASKAIAFGREAGLAARDELERLRVDDDRWNAWLEEQRRPERRPPIVRTVRIDPRTHLSPRVIHHFSRIREGKPLTSGVLERTRQELVGLGLFEGIEILVEPVPGSPGEVDVTLRPVEKSWGPSYIRFGLGISSDLGGEGDFDFGFQHTWTPLNRLAGEWRNEVQVGTRTRLFTEFYQPLDAGLRWFVAPSIEFAQDNVALTVDREKIAEVNAEVVEGRLDVGRNLGSWGEVRVGYGYATGTIRPEIATPGLLPAKIEVDAATVRASLFLDTLDDVSFPHTGALGAVGWSGTEDSLDEGERKEVLQALLATPLSFGDWTVLTSVEGGSTLVGEHPLGGEFQLGGFRRLSGLAPGELSGNHYALAVLQPYVALSDRTSAFALERYLGGTLEYGGLWQEQGDATSNDLYWSGSVYLGLETLLGPVFVGLGVTEGGDRSAYVFVGPTL